MNVSPDSSDTQTLTLLGLVEDSLIEVDYTYRMPRTDIIVMYKDRSIGIVRGVPHKYDLILPGMPPALDRWVEVKIDASGYGPNEAVQVFWEVFSGTFTIPEGVAAGTKLVRLQGTYTTGNAYFVGIHEVSAVPSATMSATMTLTRWRRHSR